MVTRREFPEAREAFSGVHAVEAERHRGMGKGNIRRGTRGALTMRAAIWFPHETGAIGDLKFQGLVQKYGLEGYGRWWVLVEKLASEENYVLMRRPYVISALAGLMRCEPSEVEAFLDDCINEFELLKTDGEAIWSDALLSRMEAREEKLRARSEAARKAAKQRWDGRETSEGEAQPMRTQSEGNATAMRFDA